MKIMVPVAGMIVAAGSCCCCGGDIESLIEEIQREVNGGSSADYDIAVDEPVAADGAGDGAGSGSAPAATGNQDGLCGRFKTDGMSVPAGLSVINCASMGTTEAVVMQGSADPKEACAPIRAWALGAGWSVTTEASIVGTQSIILKQADKQLTVACTDQTGQTTVSVSISQGY
jgi:hypothetical protein